MNDVLLPYQAQWAADPAKVKIWEKSRRIGASYGEALLSVLEAAKSRQASGQNTYYLSYNKEMTQGFIKDCAFWAKVFNCACDEMEEIVLKDEDKDITVYRIRFASGYEICGMPSEPRSLRSKQGRVIIDEAAFVEKLSELLKAALALLMWGGSVSIISTHNGEDNPFNELIKDVRGGKFHYSLHHTTLDDAISEGLYKKICEQLKKTWTLKDEEAWRDDLINQYGEGADEELFCVPNKSSGAYLTASMIEACMPNGQNGIDDIPVFTWLAPADDFVDWAYEKSYTHTNNWLEEYVKPCLDLLPSGYASFLGEDFGRSGDLTIMWAGTEMPNLDIAINTSKAIGSLCANIASGMFPFLRCSNTLLCVSPSSFSISLHIKLSSTSILFSFKAFKYPFVLSLYTDILDLPITVAIFLKPLSIK